MKEPTTAAELAELPPSKIVALAYTVSDRVQLKDVAFEDFSAKRADRSRFRDVIPKVTFTQKVAQIDKDEAGLTLIIRVAFNVVASDEGEPQSPAMLDVGATLSLRYTVESFEGLSNVKLAAFAYFNGIFNAWPYWREYVQSATVRLGLPPLTAPVHRIPVDDAGPPKAEESPPETTDGEGSQG